MEIVGNEVVETRSHEALASLVVHEVPEGMSDEEIDEYLKSKYPNKEFQWCDGVQDIFGDF